MEYDTDDVMRLGLSQRVEKALRDAGLTSISALQAKTDTELIDLPAFGQVALDEVRAALKSLEGSTVSAPPPDASQHGSEGSQPSEPPSPPPAADGPTAEDNPATAGGTPNELTVKLLAFANDFAADVPLDATDRQYSPNARDRWHEVDIGVPDGKYLVDGHDWVFSFADGRFTGADRVTVIIDA